jgi:polysaccharide export outer membrane protein
MGLRLRFTAFAVIIWICSIPGMAQTPPEVERGYAIGVGDELEITAYQEEEISGKFTVEVGGAISFPLLGSVLVAGMTVAEISVVLEDLLEKDYYVDVQLKVVVQVFSSQPVTLLGEVKKPGTFYLEGRTTLTELLSEAGGLTASAGPVLELRRTAPIPGEGPPPPMVFSTAKLLTGEAGRDVFLKSGDVLFVSAKRLYFITGEIARPGQYEISLGLTLLQALSQAGGVGKFASQAIEVHRDVAGEKQILSFDRSQIRKGKTSDPAVLAGDVLIVKRRFF